MFQPEYCGVEPTSIAMPPSSAPSIHPSIVLLLVLAPSEYQTSSLLISGLTPLCHSHLREFDHEWLVVCISWYHPLIPHL